jgi:phosphopentomutase
MKRVFLIILDSLGIGAAADADAFGDLGANTLKSCYKTGLLEIPNLTRLGLGNIEGVDFIEKSARPEAATARLSEISLGKDTTIGHWEIAGIVSSSPLPTYPGGFPKEVTDAFSAATGRGILCNKPYSGTEVIRDYGEEHIKTGKLIVYTSADSVFQIAAHEDIVPPEKLYEYCLEARKILVGRHAVGRVIARPFIGSKNDFVRTANRRDFSIEPPKSTMLDAIMASGLDVIAVGKISDIFAGRGISEKIKTKSNADGIEAAISLTKRDFHGLAFINLVDFDSLYGHRQDAEGYALALNEFDARLGKIIEGLRDDDALIITADHGCDPSDNSTDHTREYVPLLVCGKNIKSASLGTKKCFATAGKLVCDMLSVEFTPDACEIISKEILL